MFLKLTSRNTNKPVYISISKIEAVEGVETATFDDSDDIVNETITTIYTDRDEYEVKESVEHVTMFLTVVG